MRTDSTSQKRHRASTAAPKRTRFAEVRALIDVATPMVETAFRIATEAAQKDAAQSLRYWLRDWAEHLDLLAKPVDKLDEVDRDELAEVALKELREWSQIALLEKFDIQYLRPETELHGAALCLHCADRILWRTPEALAV